jgi:hypothetical protein
VNERRTKFYPAMCGFDIVRLEFPDPFSTRVELIQPTI